MKSSGCIGYLCSDGELSSMGLSSGALTAEFTMSDGTVHTFMLGSEITDQDGSTYFCFTMPDFNGVYKMAQAGAQPLFEAAFALCR